MSRILIIIGVLLVLIGILWPWLGKVGLGRLPGDIVIEREHFRFYFPLTTGLIISILVTVLFWILRK
ncbi:MAG: DUF2905 domain-containing protein [Gammaproteobacteria bacterium]|nr:DUF2905 domain-containing protein [Gammaproteobacteria bacterium]MCI0590494.1 DUF2905 domain-containing protein [Gammaproteobacteria bacterium]